MEKAIKTPLPQGGMGWSAVGKEEIDAVVGILQSPQNLFRHRGEASMCDLFEKEAAEKMGMKYARFVATGTGALSCCLSAFEIGPGDEVIVPAYTFISTASSVIEVGAVPIIAEVDDSLGMDPEDLENKITSHTRAVIVVHMQGVPARLDALRLVAKRHNLVIIEDCCQAIGATYKGKYCGTLSNAFAWSLNYYKVITGGEGGMFFTDDVRAFQRGVYQSDPSAKILNDENGKPLNIPAFAGISLRGNELSAAILREQLKKLDSILTKLRSLKKELVSNLMPSDCYKLRHCDDPDGECGNTVTFIAKDVETALKIHKRAIDQGLNLELNYFNGSTDEHVYANWTAVINKQSATKAGYPWYDPSYKGSADYSADMCPKTLDLLSRSLRFTININMTAQNMLEVADAVNIAAAEAGI